MDAFWTAAVAGLLALCVAPVQARDASTPTPPEAVTAAMTDAGNLVSWLPPLLDGGHPVQGYAVYRLTDLKSAAWTLAGSTDALTTQFTDSTTGSALYYVTATNAAGTSPPSVPAFSGSACPPLTTGVDDEPPYVDAHVNEDCLPIEVKIQR